MDTLHALFWEKVSKWKNKDSIRRPFLIYANYANCPKFPERLPRLLKSVATINYKSAIKLYDTHTFRLPITQRKNTTEPEVKSFCACAILLCQGGSISRNVCYGYLHLCWKFHTCIHKSTILSLCRLAIVNALEHRKCFAVIFFNRITSILWSVLSSRSIAHCFLFGFTFHKVNRYLL